MPKWRITWKKSFIGHQEDQRATIRSLGLHRLHQTVELPDTPVVRGMIHKVRHLLKAELVSEEAQATPSSQP